jgi:NAD(P)H dehydrogenase (quinone)
MIVVTGGNGQLGRLIAEQLYALIGPGFVVTVRDPAKAADLAAKGIAVRAGDFDKPDEVAPAVEGGETLLLMATVSPQDIRIRQYKTVIDAAKRAGVKRVAFVGYLADQPDSPFPSAASIHETLAYLRTSGVPAINLRNGNYAEAGLATAERALASGKLALPAGDGRVSYVTRFDLARATAKVLADAAAYEGKDVSLSGPAAYGYEELAELASGIGGKKIVYEPISAEAYRAALVAAGTPEGFIGFMTASAETTRRGLLAEVTTEIADITGTPPEDGLAYIRRQLTK